MTALKSDDSPVYLRLRAMIAEAILRGDYRAGDQLPLVRVFAAEHGANPLTVAKAYERFQDVGYVEVRRGVGMFVLPGAGEPLRVAERDEFITQVGPRVSAHNALPGLDTAELRDAERAGQDAPAHVAPAHP